MESECLFSLSMNLSCGLDVLLISWSVVCGMQPAEAERGEAEERGRRCGNSDINPHAGTEEDCCCA